MEIAAGQARDEDQPRNRQARRKSVVLRHRALASRGPRLLPRDLESTGWKASRSSGSVQRLKFRLDFVLMTSRAARVSRASLNRLDQSDLPPRLGHTKFMMYMTASINPHREIAKLDGGQQKLTNSGRALQRPLNPAVSVTVNTMIKPNRISP